MRGRALATAALACWLPAQAPAAPTLNLPSAAKLADERVETLSSVALPIGPWADGAMSTLKVEGVVTQTAWHMQGNATTLQILAPLRDQLTAEGFDILFECETRSCGGFDFRYEIDVLPEPVMHVDLGDFRFLTAGRRSASGDEHVSLIVSRSSSNGFVQMMRVGPAAAQPLAVATASSKSPDLLRPLNGDFATRIEAAGTLPLDDLVFETGSSDLGPGTFPSLSALADYLAAHPDRRVTLVGHTDAEGSLAGNIALSKRRAQSVVRRLVEAHGADAGRVTAEGVGFLAPRASNLTPDGRTQNRRVEVMLTSTR